MVYRGVYFWSYFFSIYMLLLCQIIQRHNVSFHCCADDTQIYLSLRPNDQRSLAAVLDCLNDVNHWMAHNTVQPAYHHHQSHQPRSIIQQYQAHCQKRRCHFRFKLHFHPSH